LERSLEKGTTIERLKITRRTIFHRAGNCVLGPKILPLDKISGGQKFYEFLALRNSAKSFTKCCGATLYKGAGNFIIPGPRKFGSVLYKRLWCSLQEGPEILSNQNF
jgi:hypothetical protein